MGCCAGWCMRQIQWDCSCLAREPHRGFASHNASAPSRVCLCGYITLCPPVCPGTWSHAIIYTLAQALASKKKTNAVSKCHGPSKCDKHHSLAKLLETHRVRAALLHLAFTRVSGMCCSCSKVTARSLPCHYRSCCLSTSVNKEHTRWWGAQQP